MLSMSPQKVALFFYRIAMFPSAGSPYACFMLVGCVTAILLMPPVARGQIFVANFGTDSGSGTTIPYTGTIAEYTNSGAPINTALITGLNDPEGIAVSGGYLFVANFAGVIGGTDGTIGEYTTSGATVNAALVSGLRNPTAIAVSGNDVFVANAYTGTIGEYTTAGATVNAALITGLYDPQAIAVSGKDLFVANLGGTIGEYTTSGATVNASLVTHLYENADALAVSGTEIFEANFNNGTIGEFSTSGATLNAALIMGNDEPQGMTAYGGNLFVASGGIGGSPGYVAEYTTSGATVQDVLIQAVGMPTGIAVVPESSTLVLLVTGAAAVLVFVVARPSGLHRDVCSGWLNRWRKT